MAQGSRKRRKRRGTHDYQAPARSSSSGPASAEGSGRGASPRKSAWSRDAKRPHAPWGSFPLVELVVLLAIVLLVVGFFVQGTRGVTMIVTGVVLGSLAGLELAVREHLAGYRSHSTVLAGVIAVLVIAARFFLFPGLPPLIGLLIAAIVFAAAFYLFREAFKRRSGGLGFR
jgi:Flp pilus assembly protein TadB